MPAQCAVKDKELIVGSETRTALIGIIVENEASVERLNALLHVTDII